MLQLNPETLSSLQDFMSGDELREFLGRVHDEWLSAWPQLQAHILAKDWLAVQKLAHRLKGSVGTVGCDGLYAALNDLENDLREDPQRLPDKLDIDRLQGAAANAEQAFLQAMR